MHTDQGETSPIYEEAWMRPILKYLAISISVLWIAAGIGSAQSPAAAQGATVALATSAGPSGPAMSLADGTSLYMLSYDTVGTATAPAVSACTSTTCLGAWPPLLAAGPNGPFSAGTGIDAGKLGTIARTDIGTSTVYQVTYAGHPLYRFIKDTAAGQSNGENVAAFLGIWTRVSTAGTPDQGVATVNTETAGGNTVLSAPVAFGGYRTLYNLTADTPTAPNCNPGCLRFWPPLLTTGAPIAGTGVDGTKLGTVKLADGTMQVTYNGMPLYHFAFDLAPGAASGLTNGEDMVDPFLGPPIPGGVWYEVSSAGVSVPGQATLASLTTSLGNAVSYSKAPVYAFSADTATTSACTGQCARIWVPVLTSGAPKAGDSGIDASGFGTIARADGTTQVTFHGSPLYMFSRDLSGTTGQDITAFGGTWRVMLTSGVTSAAGRPTLATGAVTSAGGGQSGSFTVTFSSQAAGAGQVDFGSGPGCSGLVEVATSDSGAGTQNHKVVVTGNDMPGTVGDNGITPGATYSFEVSTTSSTGTVVDDNGGKCYSVTIPTK
jgi:predicted lipoprotein with Yx(FWY)xxD motif